MSSYEYKRIYHPKLGRFVYEHKGSGIIVDNIFKPVGRVLSKVPEMVLKPFAKKRLNLVFHMLETNWEKKLLKKAESLLWENYTVQLNNQ